MKLLSSTSLIKKLQIYFCNTVFLQPEATLAPVGEPCKVENFYPARSLKHGSCRHWRHISLYEALWVHSIHRKSRGSPDPPEIPRLKPDAHMCGRLQEPFCESLSFAQRTTSVKGAEITTCAELTERKEETMSSFY